MRDALLAGTVSALLVPSLELPWTGTDGVRSLLLTATLLAPACWLVCAALPLLQAWTSRFQRVLAVLVELLFPMCAVLVLFGAGALLGNLLLIDAALQGRIFLAYAVSGLVAAVVALVLGWRRRAHILSAAAPDAPLLRASLLALTAVFALTDAIYYPHAYYTVHRVLLVACVISVSWFSTLALAVGPLRRALVAVAAAATLTGIAPYALGQDAATTYRAALGPPMLPQRVLVLARRALDRDGDLFSARLGGGDCDDADRRAFPLSVKGRDCLGWMQRTVDASAVPAAGSTREPEVALGGGADVVVLVTIDAFRCGFGRQEWKPELRDACPRLTEMAARGRFTLDAHSSCPRTETATRDLLSLQSPFDPARHEALLPGFLAARGYRTHAIVSHARQFTREGSGEPVFMVTDRELVPRALAGSSVTAEVTTDKVLAAIAQTGSGKLFLWAHYFDPHAPYVDPPGSAWALKPAVARYAAEVRRTDAAIGRLARELVERKLSRRVILLITADHGEELGAQGTYYHGFSLHEPAVRVPMLLWSPDVELMTTLGRGLPAGTTEIAPFLRSLALGEPFTSTGEAFMHAETYSDDLFAVYKDGWKLVHHHRFAYSELFDLRADAGESHDLFASRPDVANALGGRLASYVRAAARVKSGATP